MKPEVQALQEQLNHELSPQFEVLRLLGEGKMARVFLARESELRRMVAIKVLRPELARDDVAPLRFAREAQSAARITHPNVTGLYQVGKLEDETPYLVMEYVEGGSLAERVAAVGPFQVDEARRILHEVASALEVAHRKGIIHRDVRPSNVLWSAEDHRPVLSDFGIAAVEPTADHTTRHLTRVGEVVMGDVGFVSPEQLMGEQVSGASDVYSLGGVGYFLLTGEGPFGGKSAVEIASQHLKGEPPQLEALREDVPGDLARLLAKCLSKNAAHRPTAADVARVTSGAAGDGDAREPNLLEDLSKRRFVQIVGAYVVAGWIGLQVFDQLADRDMLPETAYRMAFGLFFVGFLAAATVAWFHGEKGHQQVGKLEVILLSMVAVLGVVVGMLVLG